MAPGAGVAVWGRRGGCGVGVFGVLGKGEVALLGQGVVEVVLGFV